MNLDGLKEVILYSLHAVGLSWTNERPSWPGSPKPFQPIRRSRTFLCSQLGEGLRGKEPIPFSPFSYPPPPRFFQVLVLVSKRNVENKCTKSSCDLENNLAGNI
jgi:hypothetical protein